MIFIPTYKRVDRQRTINLFPESSWGVDVTLVHLQNEDHGKYPSLIIDDENGSSISKKRQWILDYGRSNNLKWIGMMDDTMKCRIISDMTFYETFRNAVDQFVKSDLDIMYFNAAYMCKLRNAAFEDPTLLSNELCVATNTYLIKPHRIPDTVNFNSPVYEDAHFSLSAMEHGLNIGFYCDLMMEPYVVNKIPGGNRDAIEFTRDLNENILKFRDLHPRYVSLKETEEGKGSRGSRYKLMCKMKKAYKENRPTLLDEWME